MAGHITEPRDLKPRPEPGRVPNHSAERGPASGRWEREAEQHHQPVHEDSATRSSRIYFFIILAVIAAAIAIFLILRPQ